MEKNKNIFMAITVAAGAVLAAFGVIYLFKLNDCITSHLCCKHDDAEE